MTGRAEVKRQEQRLDAVFQRAASLQDEGELLSHFSRYLCILVSGFLEQAVIELVLDHVRTHAHPSVQRHIELRLRKATNLKTQRLKDLLGSFDPDWRADLESYLVDEYKDAVDGIVDLRNRISHGQSVGVTMTRIRDYYGRVKHVVGHIADLCVPI